MCHTMFVNCYSVWYYFGLIALLRIFFIFCGMCCCCALCWTCSSIFRRCVFFMNVVYVAAVALCRTCRSIWAWAEDLSPGCRFGLPFFFIVEAHRVGFPFLVVFLQLNRSFGAICGIEGFWTAYAVASVGWLALWCHRLHWGVLWTAYVVASVCWLASW